MNFVTLMVIFSGLTFTTKAQSTCSYKIEYFENDDTCTVESLPIEHPDEPLDTCQLFTTGHYEIMNFLPI